MSVLVALEVVFSQQVVIESRHRHVEHDGDPFQVQTLQCGRRVQSSATDDVSSWSASISYFTVAQGAVSLN